MFPKLAHAGRANMQAITDLERGWAQAWQQRGVKVFGWVWVEGDPIREADQAVSISEDFGLDGLIVNAEIHYEGASAWKSEVFARRFRELAPYTPLAVSHIGYGAGPRPFDYGAWMRHGAIFMPQAYTDKYAISVPEILRPLDEAGIPRSLVVPTLGTSTFQNHYSASQYVAELKAAGIRDFNVWLLENTLDGDLRTLLAAR
jgi:hypothetical protein